jgi:hypothetical protein
LGGKGLDSGGGRGIEQKERGKKWRGGELKMGLREVKWYRRERREERRECWWWRRELRRVDERVSGRRGEEEKRRRE